MRYGSTWKREDFGARAWWAGGYIGGYLATQLGAQTATADLIGTTFGAAASSAAQAGLTGGDPGKAALWGGSMAFIGGGGLSFGNSGGGSGSGGIDYPLGAFGGLMVVNKKPSSAQANGELVRYADAGTVKCDACQYVSDDNAWSERFYRDFRENLAITHEFFYGSLGKSARSALGFGVSAAFVRDIGTLSWKDAIYSLPIGGVANLGRIGSLASAAVTWAGKTLLVAGSLETGIYIGAWARATVTATFPQGYTP